MMDSWKRSRWLNVGAAFAALAGLAGCTEDPVPLENPPPADGGQVAPGGAPQGEPGAAPAGGNPDGLAGPPADPAGGFKIDQMPPNLSTQESLQGSGNAITIRGTLTGDACRGKTTRIEVLKVNDKGMVDLLAAKLVKDVGAFEILVPKTGEEAWITANCDVNDDGVIREGEDHTGGFARNPIKPQQDVADVTIALTDANPVGVPPAPQSPPAPSDGLAPEGGAPPPAGAPGAAPGDAGAPPPAGQ